VTAILCWDRFCHATGIFCLRRFPPSNVISQAGFTLLLQGICANILRVDVLPAPGYNQYILAEFLMKEVANQVTLISPYHSQNAPLNYKTIRQSTQMM
jgi:hypothetical protein